MTIAQVASIVSAFATTIIFANTLTENAFGTYRYLISIGGIFAVFSLSGMTAATLQATAKGLTGYVLQSVKIQLRYDSLAYAAGTMTSLYYYLQSDIVLATGILIVTLLVPLHNTLQNIFSYFEGQSNYQQASFFHTLKMVTVTIATLAMLLVTQNILILLATYLGVQTLANLIIFLCKKPEAESVIDPSSESKYLSYAKHTSIRNIIATIATKTDSLLIFQNLGASELAIYSLANILPEQIKNQFKNIARLLVPKYVTYSKFEVIKKNISLRSFQLFVFTLAITIVYVLSVPILYPLFLPNYPDAILLSQLIALAFPAMIAIIPMSALQAQHEEYSLHAINTFGFIFTVVVTATLILSAGLIGAVMAKVISRYGLMLLAYYYFYKLK